MQEDLNRTLETHQLYDNPFLNLGDYRRILIASPLSCASLRPLIQRTYPDAPIATIDYPLFLAPDRGFAIGGRIAKNVAQMAREPVAFVHLQVSRRLDIPKETRYSHALYLLSKTTGISGALLSYRFTHLIVAII